MNETNYRKLSYVKTANYDQELRYNLRDKLNLLLHYIYNLDVFISVAGVSKERNFAFAKALSPETNILEMEGVFPSSLKESDWQFD